MMNIPFRHPRTRREYQLVEMDVAGHREWRCLFAPGIGVHVEMSLQLADHEWATEDLVRHAIRMAVEEELGAQGPVEQGFKLEISADDLARARSDD
jgi:hypothetical protein